MLTFLKFTADKDFVNVPIAVTFVKHFASVILDYNPKPKDEDRRLSIGSLDQDSKDNDLNSEVGLDSIDVVINILLSLELQFISHFH